VRQREKEEKIAFPKVSAIIKDPLKAILLTPSGYNFSRNVGAVVSNI